MGGSPAMQDVTALFIALGSGLLMAAVVWGLWLRGARRKPPHGAIPQMAEVARLGEIFDALPVPAWEESEAGRILRVNAAYAALAGAPPGAPPSVLFPPGGAARRAPAGQPDGPQFDCCSAPLPGGGRVHLALPADAALSAEATLARFMQTLAKTFAHLPTGLAIFDSDRRLALFNPALGDLTGLPPGWLSERPTLVALLDRLRAMRVLPEPKDYQSWRRHLSEVERLAREGHYAEDWALPGGRVLRVTGQPQPGGALAFLMEDITGEVALRRRFRLELSLGQSVLDAMDEGVAVFGADGRLMATNAAYAALWGSDPGALLADLGAADLLTAWSAATGPAPVWARARDFLASPRDRRAWQAEVALAEGGRLCCRFVPLARGATLCAFRRRGGGAVASPAHLPEADLAASEPQRG
ncbi:MAG: diguanylate cyclase [Alphaproteobacteria bacterium HGW-Alphaproteobacteria-2]|nr:MAG: diguanylate cyclase [Alphaproteobacteria bacterium HGW-Alphaproteobacteria-2]